MSKKEKATREYLETLSKDQVIDLCLQFMFDSEVAEKQLDQANERLGKLEDILEKYGIESVEELKDALENKIEDISNPFLQGYVRAFFKDRLQYVEFELDTWKRACELACKHIAEVEWFSCPETDDISESENEIKTLTKQSLNFFYQQAKKEGENGQ